MATLTGGGAQIETRSDNPELELAREMNSDLSPGHDIIGAQGSESWRDVDEVHGWDSASNRADEPTRTPCTGRFPLRHPASTAPSPGSGEAGVGRSGEQRGTIAWVANSPDKV
jgi:hypothetical protein